MFRRTRYQDGTIVRVRRSRIPDYWALRWWDIDANGKRIRRKAIIGPVTEYPTEASARKAAETLRMTINEASPKVDQRPISVSALIGHYIQHELCAGDDESAKSFATQHTNKDFLRLAKTIGYLLFMPNGPILARLVSSVTRRNKPKRFCSFFLVRR